MPANKCDVLLVVSHAEKAPEHMLQGHQSVRENCVKGYLYPMTCIITFGRLLLFGGLSPGNTKGQDMYQFVTVCTHGDYIVMLH